MTLTAPTPDNITADQAEDQSVWQSFRLSPSERAELKDHAHLARISVSELVRGRSLNKPPPRAAVPAINVQTYNELGRIGNNLNQQTHLCHQAGGVVPAHLQPLARVLAELKGLLDQVRLEVIGADQQTKEDKE